MTYQQAIESLRAGEAAKRPSWRGYIKKTTAEATPDVWSSTAAYSVGQKTVQYGRVYICVSPVAAPASGSVNVWDSTKWLETQVNYNITFRESHDPESGIGADDVEEYVFSRTQSVTEGATSVMWQTIAPAERPLSVDAQLFDAQFADDWVTGSTAEFEKARDGSDRW